MFRERAMVKLLGNGCWFFYFVRTSLSNHKGKDDEELDYDDKLM